MQRITLLLTSLLISSGRLSIVKHCNAQKAIRQIYSDRITIESKRNRFLETTYSKEQSICKMSSSFSEEVARQKQYYDSMPLDEKRTLYKCGAKYLTLANIPTWIESPAFEKLDDGYSESNRRSDSQLNSLISLHRGDITSLEIDAIVNAANSRLAGGGGVDEAIHSAASRQLLLNECSLTGHLPTGNSLLTSGYKLPAKRVIHTVGPIGEDADLLRNCYINSLNLAKSNGLRSIAFPCISTGVYGYPNERAANVALSAVRDWLESNHASMDRVIFCVFLQVDVEIYTKLLPGYFPK